MPSFEAAHRWIDNRLKNYIEYPKSNYVFASHEAAVEMRPDEALYLHANNMESRIRFAETALRHVQDHHGLQAGPVHFVTITPAAFALRLRTGILGNRHASAAAGASPAAKFDIRQMQATARQALGDSPFIGMVEPGLYRNWGPHGPCRGYYVSWHCHLLTWGVSHAELTLALAQLRSNHRSLLGKSSPAHIKPVPQHHLERQLHYMLKAPQKVAGVNFFPHESVNPETGEVRPPGWHQQKAWMGTGQRVLMMEVLKERLLDQLFFGNGEGTLLARGIRKDALAEFRQQSAIS